MSTVKVQFKNAKAVEFRSPVCKHIVQGKEVPLLVAKKDQIFEVDEVNLTKLTETGYFVPLAGKKPVVVKVAPVAVEKPETDSPKKELNK